MKKIFTLIAASFLTIASFAADADRRPDVTLRTSGNYEVIIDGKSYFSRNGVMELSNMRGGQHSIKVYQINNRPFRKIKKLVSASSFTVKNKDVNITVDSRGQISIFEEKSRKRDNRWDDNDWKDQDKRDRDRRY